jgi:hypothetical protein
VISLATVLYMAAAGTGIWIFGVFVGHVVGFGFRTRHVQLLDPPRTDREARDRQGTVWVRDHADRLAATIDGRDQSPGTRAS